MQASVDDWEGGIRATGGAIVPEKSHWYLVSFDWDGSAWVYNSTADTPYEVTVRNSNGIRIPLPRMETSEASMTLGVFLAPDGNNQAAVEHLRGKMIEWRDQIRSSHLQKSEAWYALTSTIWKSIEYPLPALTLTYNECNYIMAPAKEGGLSKSGICQKLQKEAVHGPLRYQGLGLNHIKITQDASHLETIRQHIWRDTPTSNLIMASLEELRLEVGLGGNLFAHPFSPFRNAATDCWLLNTWKFISQHPFAYQESGSYQDLQCEGDQFIMQLFLDCGYSGESLRKLNSCRMHLEATTVSDLTTGDGKRMLASQWHGHRIPHTSRYNWPTQPRPRPTTWNLWQEALKRALTLIGQDHPRLPVPLGPWTVNPHLHWTWFYSPSDNRMYEKLPDHWQFYSRLATRRLAHYPIFSFPGLVDSDAALPPTFDEPR